MMAVRTPCCARNSAVNIPTDELPQRFAELPKNKEVVPYCWSVVCHLATRASLFLAEQGYVVASIQYRMMPEHRLPDCVEDCKAAVRWLRQNSVSAAL